MSSGSPGRVKHLVPAWWQALQPGSLIVHRIVIIVLSNDLFLWFWQDKEGKRTAVRTRDIPILQSGPGETHSHSHGLCVCARAPGLTYQSKYCSCSKSKYPNIRIYQKIYSNLFCLQVLLPKLIWFQTLDTFFKKSVHIYSASEFK